MENHVYDTMYEREQDFWWHKGMKEIISQAADRVITQESGHSILDIGCGTGGNFDLLSKYGTVYGIDASEKAVEYARKRGIAREVQVGKVQHMPYEDDRFDIVGCFDVLYHGWIQDDTEVMREIHRILKPGGYLVIREPAYNWLRSQHDTMVQTSHRYTRSELNRKLAAAGLKSKYTRYINSYLFPIALAKRVVEKVFPEKHPEEHLFQKSALDPLLYGFMLAESRLNRFVPLPFGLSILTIATKES